MWPLNDILAAWRNQNTRYKLIDAWKVLNMTSSRRVAAADIGWAVKCACAGDPRAKARVTEAYELMIIQEMTR